MVLDGSTEALHSQIELWLERGSFFEDPPSIGNQRKAAETKRKSAKAKQKNYKKTKESQIELWLQRGSIFPDEPSLAIQRKAEDIKLKCCSGRQAPLDGRTASLCTKMAALV